MDEQLEASRRDALCTQAHAWLEVGGESDGDVVVTRERCVHCGEERTTEAPRRADSSEGLVPRLAAVLRREAVEHGKSARGAAWEHHVRTQTILSDAADLLESLALGCEIAYQREPTQSEADAHAGGSSETFVPMGGWTARRCRVCGRWVFGGPTACVSCASQLSALDRADISAELEERAGQCERLELECCGSRVDHWRDAAPSWRARALRIRQLIALLAVLLLSACAAAHGRIEGPPLYVHLCHEMPAADAEAWGEAAGALNRELEDAALFVGHGPPRGCDSVDVCPSDDVLADAETHVGTCVVTVRYAPGTAREVATQELDALLERWRTP